MPRHRIRRTPDEEIEFQRIRKARNAENQRRRRAIARTNTQQNRVVVSRISDDVTVPLSVSSVHRNVPNSEYHQRGRARQRNQTVVDNSSSDNPLRPRDEHYIGMMNVLCSCCGAKHFAAEKVSNKVSFNDCCSHGEVALEALPDPPRIIRELFDGTHAESNHFFDRIRNYNNSFSFASFNANLVNFNNTRRGPYCFKIQGQIYYQVNTSLYPTVDENPSYGQLFIIDPNEASDFRCNRNTELNPIIVRDLETVMRECNIFAHSYQMMQEELRAQQVLNGTGNEPELQLLFTLKPGMDRNRYNFQRTNEVAMVFSTTSDGEIPESYVTIRNKQTKELQYVARWTLT